jgi:hypothetical protein
MLKTNFIEKLSSNIRFPSPFDVRTWEGGEPTVTKVCEGEADSSLEGVAHELI